MPSPVAPKPPSPPPPTGRQARPPPSSSSLFYSPFLPLLFIVLSFSSLLPLPLPLPLATALPATINIGAVFSKDRIDQEIAFNLSIRRLNMDRAILPQTQLVPKISHIVPHDSFHGNKKVCGLLREGVVAIFDPFDGHISHHIQSICDAKDIPHIESRWEFKHNRNDPESINLFPKTSLLTKAYIDLVKAWHWEHFAIVYEESEGLYRMQDFFKEAETLNWKIKLHQFEAGKPYRETFWRIKEEGELNIILDVKNENIFRALKHAQQVGLITESHSYLITQLDLHMIDLEDFKFGKTKITAFSLINNETEEHRQLMADWKRDYPQHYTGQISTEAALLYDGVKMLAMAIRDLDHSQAIQIQQVNCDNSEPWAQGSSLINFMRPVQFRGLTGYVGFDDLTGARSKTMLRIVTVNPNGLEEIGSWHEGSEPTQRLNISTDWMNHYSSSALQNKTLLITTVINKPYTMEKEASDKLVGNDRYEGYAIDLIHELSKILHFKYEFRLVKDGAYGRPDKNGSWNGMMGELIRGEVDLAVADLTITSKREDAVDFTHPFMNTGISILFKKPTKKVTSLFSFLSPFSNIVWIYVLCAYIGVSSILFVVGRLSPYEWENPHPCRHEEEVLENGFSLSNSFWFTIGSLMQQASDLTPKAMSTRTIAAIWYFFTLIMIASYTANLAAFLTVEKIVYPIENADQLAEQTKIKYGCLSSGSTASFFSESNITTYKKMWEFMSKNPEVFMKKNEDGKDAVEQGEGNYAYLMESASIEYIIERNCNLTQIGGLLDSKGYGVATAKDSPYRMPLSQAILQLQESGQLLILKERWWKQKKGGGQCVEDTKKGSGTVMPLKIDNVGGVFVVLLGGLSFSLFVVIMEFVWRARTNLKQESVCEEIIHDLKFALMCQSSSKFVKPQVPHSPDSEIQRLEYYPPAHFRRGPGHYPPPVSHSPEPYIVSNTPMVAPKRPGYSIGPPMASTTTLYSATPKSRTNSRLSGKLQQSEHGEQQQHRSLGESATHRTLSRVPLYHYDDCALAGSNSALNFTTLIGPSIKGKAGQSRHLLRPVQQPQQQQQQFFVSQSSAHGSSSAVNSATSSKGLVRLNGSRVLSRPLASQVATVQSNSCSDLVLREVVTGSASGSGSGNTAGGGGGVHRVRSGSSMRSVGGSGGKISSQYSVSLEGEELAHSLGAQA